METLNLFKAVCLLYEELYRQASLNKSFDYKPQRNDTKLIVKFIGWLKANYSVGQTEENFLIAYFRFQFARYAGVVTPNGRNSVMMNWLIGQKAIAAWQNRNVYKTYMTRYKIKREFALQLELAFKPLQKVKVNKLHKTIVLSENWYEEVEKQKYLNTEQGYLYCAQMTTMYNPISKNCRACVFAAKCTERLKVNYEQIYNLRFKL